MTTPISKELLVSFRALANKVSVGILAIADSPNFPIVFASKIESLLGYTSDEINGQPFAILLPPEMRSRHDAYFEQIRNDSNATESRAMQGGLPVKGIHKNGEEVTLLVDISGHPSIYEEQPGIFLAFIQNPDKVELAPGQISTLKIQYKSLLDRSEEVVKIAWKAIARKIAARGGAVSFVIWLLTQITPLGTALKGFIAAWNLQADSALKVDDVRVYNGISEETRILNLTQIRDVLREIDPKVLAVAFYRYSYNNTTKNARISYRGDSNEVDGSENFFPDLTLTDIQNEKLNNHECIFISEVVELRNRSDRPYTGMILCPTFTIGRSDFPNLDAIKSANIAAFSVELDWKYTENVINDENHETLITTFWTLATPNLDVNFAPILKPPEK